jgi:hypothetical protein
MQSAGQARTRVACSSSDLVEVHNSRARQVGDIRFESRNGSKQLIDLLGDLSVGVQGASVQASGPRCLSTLAIFPSSARGGRDLLDHVMIVSTSARRLTAQITTGWWSDVGTPVLHADGLRTRWWRFGTINVDAPRLVAILAFGAWMSVGVTKRQAVAMVRAAH